MLSWESATDALGAALNTAAGESIVYASGDGITSIPLTAVRGRSSVSVEDTDGAVMQVLSHDFLVAAADLAALGRSPQKGDTITVQSANALGIQGIFELMSPPYSPSDHQGRRLRIHTVRIT